MCCMANPPSQILCDSSIRFAKSVGVFADYLIYLLKKDVITMKTVKEKPPGGKPRTLQKNVRMPPAAMRAAADRMRDRTQEQAEQQQESAANYAVDRSSEIVTDTVRVVGDTAKEVLRPDSRKPNATRYESAETEAPHSSQQAARQRYARERRSPQYSQRQSAERAAFEPAQQAARRSAAKQAQQTASAARRAAIKTADKAAKTPKRTAQAGVKTAKASVKTVKTAQTAAAKTAQATKAAARGSQAAAKAAVQAARVAAKAIAAAAKVAAKAAVTVAKAVAGAAKGLIAAIAAGGWVVIVIIIAVGAVAAILCSAFGVFFSDEADPGKLKQAIVDVNTGFTAGLQSEIDRLSAGGYDAVNVIYEGDFDGDSFMVNNWTDVLGVYAVKTTTDKTAGDEVLTVTPEKETILSSTFNDMNAVDIRTETETDTTTTTNADGEKVEETTVTLNVYISIQSLTYLEGAELYSFDEYQLELLEELMSPQYYSFFAELIDVDLYGGLTASDFANLVNDLPAGTKGGAIAQAAIAKIGTPYSVMDCSDLSQYAYAQAGVSIPGTSVTQAQYCYNNGYTISSSALQPGDLVFWSKTSCRCGRWNEIHHVGIYIGNGRIVDASSKNGRVMLRDIWSSGNWPVVLYARSHVG